MKLALAWWLVVMTVVSSAPAQQVTAEQAAQKTAESWLNLVDDGKYGESWQQASSFFKTAVTRDQWTQSVQKARGPFGKLLQRRLKSSRHATTLPGAPDGQYFVLQFDASFEHKKAAVETVTAMLDRDGHWRVAGYFIR